MTIYDIAKEAKTSISTVSRYLNNKPIMPETKKRIEAVLAKSNYKPSAVARGLVSKKMKTVAVLTVDIRVPHYAKTTYMFEQEFSKRGYNVIICNTSGSVSKAISYLNNLTNHQVDGIAFVGSIFNQLNDNLEVIKLLDNVPVVIANGALNTKNAYSVYVDDVLGSTLAINYLVQKGRKNIYYLKDLDTASAKMKEAGFIKAMMNNHLEWQNHIINVSHSIDAGNEAFSKIFTNLKKCDAILCGEDLVAVGLINVLMNHHLNVGKDVDVIAFNNTMYSLMTRPRLTVIENKPEIQGLKLVDLLEKLIEGNNDVNDILIKPDLIIRESA